MMTIKRSVYILDGKYDINIYSVYYSMFYEKYDIEDYIYIYQFLVIATSLVKCYYRFVWFPSSTDLSVQYDIVVLISVQYDIVVLISV